MRRCSGRASPTSTKTNADPTADCHASTTAPDAAAKPNTPPESDAGTAPDAEAATNPLAPADADTPSDATLKGPVEMPDEIRQEAEQRRFDFGSIVMQLAELRAVQLSQGGEISKLATATTERDFAMSRLSRRSRLASKRLRVIGMEQVAFRKQLIDAAKTTEGGFEAINRRLVALVLIQVLFSLGGVPEVRALLLEAARHVLHL